MFVTVLWSFCELDISVLILELLTEPAVMLFLLVRLYQHWDREGRKEGKRFADHEFSYNQHQEVAGAGRLMNTCPLAI